MTRVPAFAAAALVTGVLALAAAADAAFPGPNGRIAFYRTDPALPPSPVGQYDLYTANPDGSHAIQVSDAPGFSSDWSADGKHLAYDFFDADGNEQIATVTPDGSGTHVLTAGPAIHEVPSFTPDGSRIVYDYSPTSPDTPGFGTSLWIMDADGANQHPLVPGSRDTFDVEPRVSPDGRSVAFVRIRVDAGKGVEQDALFTMRLDGRDVRRLTRWSPSLEMPDWSPDGRSLVYYSVEGKDGSPSVHLIRADGNGDRKLYKGNARVGGARPVFSPDGTTILFACVTLEPSFDVDLCTMDTHGSHVVDLTNTSAPGSLESRPSWGTAPLL